MLHALSGCFPIGHSISEKEPVGAMAKTFIEDMLSQACTLELSLESHAVKTLRRSYKELPAGPTL